MKFEQEGELLGVVGKKGTGTLDNGNAWSTDRVELHIRTPFPESETMAFGETVTSYAVQNFDENFSRARAMLNKKVVLHMEMVPAKKLGQAARFICTGFNLHGEHKINTVNKSVVQS